MRAISNVSKAIGFRPWEISAMINQEVIDQHAEEAAFLWTQREHATCAPQYALRDLAKLDERVEAHLDGLRVAATAGWDTAAAQLDQGRGEVFAAAVLAFESGDSTRTDAVLAVGCSAAPLASGLVSALGWLRQDMVIPQARVLLTSQQSEIRRTGIAGMAVHRLDPGSPLSEAIADRNCRLAARAIKAAAELGRRELVPDILERLSDGDENCRFWAAWSAVRLGERRSNGAIAILRAAAVMGGPHAAPALDLALRVMPLEDSHRWRELLAGVAATSLLAVTAAGVMGDPSVVPDLISAMENPKLARDAGNSFSMITGADLSYEDLTGPAPLGADEEDDDMPGIDADFPWPLPAAVARWWVKRAAGYTKGVRYLCGKAMTDRSLQEVLIGGRQNQRAAAAMELALRHPSEILFETRERAQWQQKKVRQWSW